MSERGAGQQVEATRAAAASFVRSAARGFHGGVGLLLGDSLLYALSADSFVWASPLLCGARAWNLLFGSAWCLFVLHGLRPFARTARLALGGALSLVALTAALDSYEYAALVRSGAISTARALPASLFVAAVSLAAVWNLRRAACGPRRWSAWCVALASAGSGALATILVALLSFGATDYRRPADCAIVLGAGVYADGSASLSLSDRVAEGVRLYEEGHVQRLLMSGGVDPRHGQSEAQVMRRLALEAGVAACDIELDELGNSTRASALNCARILAEHGWRDALLVSHDYHLLRAKTAFARAGVRVYTVPATETRPLARGPYFVARECLAWLYYALPEGSASGGPRA